MAEIPGMDTPGTHLWYPLLKNPVSAPVGVKKVRIIILYITGINFIYMYKLKWYLFVCALRQHWARLMQLIKWNIKISLNQKVQNKIKVASK